MTDFDDLITAVMPQPNRLGKSDGDHEHHLYEGVAMTAFVVHLLRIKPMKEVTARSMNSVE